MPILIAFLLGVLTGIKRTDPINKTAESTNQSNNRSPLSAGDSGAQLTVEANQEPHKRKNNRLEIYMAVVHTLTMGAVVWYAILTNSLLNTNNLTVKEIQKQTTLMRQQLVGAQQAVIRVNQPEWEGSKSELAAYVVDDGVVDAVRVNFKAEIFEESLPKETPIGDPVVFELPYDDVLQSKNGVRLSRILPWHQPTVDIDKWPGKVAFVYRGHISYDNGFGDLRSADFCFLWLPRWSIQGKQQGWGGGGSFQPGCDIKTAVRNFLDVKKRAAE
jgi:hypothetical protein